ncbi:MAG TPA: hypothetical protein VG055_13215 [Planctomycetaceae bacterium]|jgi:hypothetical protein|nr:hypothetical protein [Planctomycetaceae bacterium]
MRIRLPRASNLLKKAIALLLLLGVLVEVAGIPVVSVAKKDRSRPYPCQDRPCGCASADECWHHCCCMNNKEKLAWARENGVTPPDFVVAAAEQENAGTTQVCEREEGGKDAVAEHACCRHKHQDVAHHDVAQRDVHDRHAKERSQPKVRLVLSDLARQCSGLPQIILLFSDALPSVAAAQWRPSEGLLGYVVATSRSCVSPDLAPPVPPPKLSGGVAA